MPRTPVYEAITERLEILDPTGQVDAELLPDLDDASVLELYRNMVRMRAFDDKALKLQRQGRMGTWPPIKGQEAIQASTAMAMGESDWLIPCFREQGVMLMRGVPGHLIYAYWVGDERGSCFPEGVRCFPIAVPVGSTSRREMEMRSSGPSWGTSTGPNPIKRSASDACSLTRRRSSTVLVRRAK